MPVTEVSASQGLCLRLSASLASLSFYLCNLDSWLFRGSALGGRGCSGHQAQGSCIPSNSQLQPLRLHRALRRLGGGCLGPSGEDLGSPAPPTPRTRWYCPPPQQVRGTEGGAGPGGEGWAVGHGVEPSDLPFLAPPGPCVCLGGGGGWCYLYSHKSPVSAS